MTRQRLLSDAHWAGAFVLPSDEREVVRHCTLKRLNKEVKRRADVVGIFPPKPRSSASSAPCCSRPTTNGNSSTPTWASRPWPSC